MLQKYHLLQTVTYHNLLITNLWHNVMRLNKDFLPHCFWYLSSVCVRRSRTFPLVLQEQICQGRSLYIVYMISYYLITKNQFRLNTENEFPSNLFDEILYQVKSTITPKTRYVKLCRELGIKKIVIGIITVLKYNDLYVQWNSQELIISLMLRRL